MFLSLGTNDAVGGALDVKAKVAAIVAEADKLGVKLVWIGPPCVLSRGRVTRRSSTASWPPQLEGTSVDLRKHCRTPEFCGAIASRRRGRALYYGGLYPHVAEGRRGRGLPGRRRLGERATKPLPPAAQPQPQSASDTEQARRHAKPQTAPAPH